MRFSRPLSSRNCFSSRASPEPNFPEPLSLGTAG